MGPHVDHKQRIDLILQNAQELFSELGYQQVTLKLLAKRCHLSRTVLYRYYKSKRNVFEAVLFHIADFIGKEFMQYVQEHKEHKKEKEGKAFYESLSNRRKGPVGI